jgi:hypothetical protein
VAVRPEIRFRLPNSPGSLARITTLLEGERVGLLALSLESNGLLRLTVDNPVRAIDALKNEHVTVQQSDVIHTMVAARSIAAVLRGIADAGVNVDYAYTSSPDAAGVVALVLGVEDAMRAASAAGL